MATRTMFSFVLFVLKPWLTFVREHGNSERILDASVVVKLLPTLKQNTLLTSTPTKVLQDCECSLLESDFIFILFFILSAGLLMSFHRHSYARSFAFCQKCEQSNAEGIQNMCATQIMTKSKSLRTGFSSQVAH